VLKDKSMNLEQFGTSQLAEMRGSVRMNVSKLEKLAQMRTVEQEHELRQQRALLRRLTRILKSRIVQLPLL
jgi:hypothetical protein